MLDAIIFDGQYAAMTLAEYLELTDLGTAEFGKKAKISQPMISQLANKTRKPSLATMVKIKKASRGQVDFQDWAK